MTNPLDAVPVESVVEAPETTTTDEITLYSREDVEAAVSAERVRLETLHSEMLTGKDAEITAAKGQVEAANIERSLTDAARVGNAFNDALVVDLLRTHTTIVDGQATVEIDNFQLTPSEAISWMRSQPDKYGTLFKSNVISGLGLSSTAGGARGGKPISLKNLSPKEYRALKKENPELIYGRGANQ